jgi:transmembrane sensor
MYTLPEERTKTLLQRYVEDILTTAERQELSDLILRYPQVWELLQEMESEGLVPPAFQEREQAEMKRGLSRIRTRIRQQEGVPFSRKGRLRRIAVFVAAAALFALVVWSACPGKPSRADGAVIAVKAVPPAINDVPPGGDRATLIMSDGRSIRLDSLPVGSSPMEGGAVKRDSGTLSYVEGKSLSIKSREGLGSIAYNKVVTPPGGQFIVVLPDGTKATLNNGSSIRYPTVFAGKTRDVTMSGEVFLKVANNPSQPFCVTVNGLSVDVLGTSFNIKAYEPESMIATVIEGGVQVSNGSQKRKLGAWEQLTVAGNKDWKFQQRVNTEEVTSWKKGNFLFAGTPLSEVLLQLKRWYDMEVDNTSASNPVYRAGIGRSYSLQTVLQILREQHKEIIFRIEGRRLIVHN